MENQVQYGNRTSENKQQYPIAIKLLQDALYSTRCELKIALEHMEQEKGGRPEGYEEIAISLKEKISQLESAISKLEKPHNIYRSL